jgi:hypothetical protein
MGTIVAPIGQLDAVHGSFCGGVHLAQRAGVALVPSSNPSSNPVRRQWFRE